MLLVGPFESAQLNNNNGAYCAQSLFPSDRQSRAFIQEDLFDALSHTMNHQG